MVKNFTYLSLVAAIMMTSCSSTQVPLPYENSSNYNYNSATSSYASNQAPIYDVIPVGFRSISCPASTISQPNGTCLIEEASASPQVDSLDAVQRSINQQYVTNPRKENVIKANAPMTSPTNIRAEITKYHGASLYQVKPGDTVYSLARRNCVTVGEIQGSNSLDRDYGIQIGQTLRLPPNHC